MAHSPVQAANAFAAHIEAQEKSRQSAKDSGGTYEPLAEDKARRDSVMQELLVALDLSKAELQASLSIDRATWDRWRAMSSIPQRSHLEAISRFAAQKEKSSDHIATRLRPHEMLSARPRTLGRLRLVYSFFPWENAVFAFNNPWYDANTATEMALLALRDCNIVYIMKNPSDWRKKFASSLVSVLGKNDAARALSKVCIIEATEDELSDFPEFGVGIFNFEAKDPDGSAGYIWKGSAESNEQSPRPEDTEQEKYDAFPSSDCLISDLREKFGKRLNQAFKRIEDSPLVDLWAPILNHETRSALLEIPIIPIADVTMDSV